MSYDLNYNYFSYLRGFERELVDNKKNPNLVQIANSLAMLGAGKQFNDDGSMEWPSDRLDLQFNEMVHHLLIEYKLLDTLRGFFEFECTLDEDHDHKLFAKGATEDMVAFLMDKPDPRYFTQES